MRLMAQFKQFATRVPQSQAQGRGLIRMAGHFSAVPGWGTPSFDMEPHCGFPVMPLFIDPEVTGAAHAERSDLILPISVNSSRHFL
jgi:hypothetical protein